MPSTIVTIVVQALAIAAVLGSNSRILYVVWQMKGIIDPWAKRLDRHSEKFDELGKVVAAVPIQITAMKNEVAQLREQSNSHYESMARQFERLYDRVTRNETAVLNIIKGSGDG